MDLWRKKTGLSLPFIVKRAKFGPVLSALKCFRSIETHPVVLYLTLALRALICTAHPLYRRHYDNYLWLVQMYYELQTY